MDAQAPKPPKPDQPLWRRYAWLIAALILAGVAAHGILTHPPRRAPAPSVDGGAPPVPGTH